MNDSLIEESLGIDSQFSSNTHAIEKVVDKDLICDKSDFTIPSRYFNTTLTFLPISNERYYFYWEFTQEFLKSQNIKNLDDIFFRIVSSNGDVLEDINFINEVGEYFINKSFNCNFIQIEAVYLKDGVYNTILRSNKVQVFNTTIVYPKSSNKVYMEKSNGFTQIIRSSMQHFTLGMSSDTYQKEMIALQEYSHQKEELFSSHTIGGVK